MGCVLDGSNWFWINIMQVTLYVIASPDEDFYARVYAWGFIESFLLFAGF